MLLICYPTLATTLAHLGVCNAIVYRLCEDGELPHIRVVNSIRIKPADLTAFITRPDW